MAAIPIRMSNIMLIDFTATTATRTNEIGQATDGGNLRTTVRAKLEFVAKEGHIVHRVPAIRACEYCSSHFFFDKAHDAGVRLDKICQVLKEVAFADYSLESLKAHRVPVDLVKAHDRRIGLTEIAQLCGDLKTPERFVAHVKSPFRTLGKISARMNPYLQSRCTP